jgi:hypothetical protein
VKRLVHFIPIWSSIKADEKERQIITDHDPAVIVETFKREYSAK